MRDFKIVIIILLILFLLTPAAHAYKISTYKIAAVVNDTPIVLREVEEKAIPVLLKIGKTCQGEELTRKCNNVMRESLEFLIKKEVIWQEIQKLESEEIRQQKQKQGKGLLTKIIEGVPILNRPFLLMDKSKDSKLEKYKKERDKRMLEDYLRIMVFGDKVTYFSGSIKSWDNYTSSYKIKEFIREEAKRSNKTCCQVEEEILKEIKIEMFLERMGGKEIFIGPREVFNCYKNNQHQFRDMSFKEAQESIFKFLKTEMRIRNKKSFVDGLMEKAYIKIYSDVFPYSFI